MAIHAHHAGHQHTCRLLLTNTRVSNWSGPKEGSAPVKVTVSQCSPAHGRGHEGPTKTTSTLSAIEHQHQHSAEQPTSTGRPTTPRHRQRNLYEWAASKKHHQKHAHPARKALLMVASLRHRRCQSHQARRACWPSALPSIRKQARRASGRSHASHQQHSRHHSGTHTCTCHPWCWRTHHAADARNVRRCRGARARRIARGQAAAIASRPMPLLQAAASAATQAPGLQAIKLVP